jgi:hypothetical protein
VTKLDDIRKALEAAASGSPGREAADARYALVQNAPGWLRDAVACIEAADELLADDDQATHTRGVVVCGYCGAVVPEEKCASNCLNAAYRTARARLEGM